jgi:hypothetical protein
MPGLLRAVARTTVIAGTATAVSNGVSRRQQGRWAQQEQAQAYQQQQQYAPQQQYAQPPPAPPPPAAPPSSDMDATIAALKQLADLNAQGILTDAEFEAQKRRLLGT